MHESGSMLRFPSFSEIASTGQALSQAPQFVHSALILYAM